MSVIEMDRPEGLWRLSEGTTVLVPFRSFSHDFRVLLAQILDEVRPHGEENYEEMTVLIHIEPFDDFREWSLSEEPDWDRYYSCGLEVLEAQKRISSLKNWNWAAREPTREDLITAGYQPSNKARQEVTRLIKKGLLPPTTIRNEEVNEDVNEEVYLLGFEQRLANIATEMRKQNGRLPPLVRWEGRPADGRHRTLAALRLGLRVAPIVDVEEIK